MKPTHWISTDHRQFTLVEVYTPFNEQDPWARYINTKTGQEYTCRHEAFLARFSPQLD